MAIDGCEHNFSKLASSVLPAYMERMRGQIQSARSLTEFLEPGVGVKSIAKRFGEKGDFSGCYVLLRNGQAFYVGISRGVIGRLRQHGKGKTHYDASLAYRMACEKEPHRTTREKAMEGEQFKKAFEEARATLIGCDVAVVKIENPLELYLFEAFCAMELDTREWNTFRTH
jgi:predicted GIY-YIG superfamily endonuclease